MLDCLILKLRLNLSQRLQWHVLKICTNSLTVGVARAVRRPNVQRGKGPPYPSRYDSLRPENSRPAEIATKIVDCDPVS